jgi:phosphatidylserine/phosphatidylglycerophosphate/cardiolipin synthase-like enzyme
MSSLGDLSSAIARLAATTTPESLDALATRLETAGGGGAAGARAAAYAVLPQLGLRDALDEVLATWAAQPGANTASLALLLRTAARVVEQQVRTQGKVELVWTGPDSGRIALRRTDQALLQVIDAATQDLLVVSFAVTAVPTIVQALHNAVARRVRVAICLESPEDSLGRLRGSGAAQEVFYSLPGVQVYAWPLNMRPRASDGRPGALHAKFAVADGHLLFVSSANLTPYAMTLNMELGVLVEGGSVPTRLAQHWLELIRSEVVVVKKV